VAEQDHAAAQNALGISYARGLGVPLDLARAAKLFRQAADQGYTPAQSSFGRYHMLGLGVAHDLADAARYFRVAADQGDAYAQCALGFLCEHGQGTKRNLVEAVRLYRAAVTQRDVHALARLGVCLEKGRGIAQRMADATARFAAGSKIVGDADELCSDGARHLDEIGELSAPEPFVIQVAVRQLALAGRLGHAGALEKLVSISSRREVASACCLGCGAARGLKQCAACRVASYCDGSCKRRMWPAHKLCCKEWRPQAAPAAE